MNVDVNFIAVYGRSGLGKTTISVALAIETAKQTGLPIVSNLPLQNLPEDIKSSILNTGAEFLAASNCIILGDQLDAILPSSSIGPTKTEREKKLLELVSNIRKNDVHTFIHNAQWRHSVRNIVRINCRYVVEPTKTLYMGYPEYLLWDDYEQYERDRTRGTMEYGYLMHSDYTLEYLQSTFDTRKKIEVEW